MIHDYISRADDIVKKWSGSLFASNTYPDGIENYGFIIGAKK